MIYCVAFADVVDYLNDVGFRETGRVGHQVIYRSDRDELLILRLPKQNEHLPESLVNDVFDAARIAPAH